MTYGLYVSADGAEIQRQRLEIVSNNMANVATTGFKRQLAVAQARYSEAVQQGDASFESGSIHDISGGVKMLEPITDFSLGKVVNTGVNTDLLLENPEQFFMIDKNGQEYMTRAGNFKIDREGNLLTQQNYPVMNEGSQPIKVPIDGGPIKIGSSGQITQQQGNTIVPLGNIGVFQPENLGDLKPQGETLFLNMGNSSAVENRLVKMQSGFLEGSSVKPTMEMLELISASRAFEANVNMIRSEDQMTSTLVNRVLRQG